jgi:hypothetical protein
MASKKANCGNCKYARPQFANEKQLECHRHAPVPYNAMVFCLGELIRDCAWSLRVAHNVEEPSEHDQLRNDVTEAPDYAVWPKIERDDWCAEWRGK